MLGQGARELAGAREKPGHPPGLAAAFGSGERGRELGEALAELAAQCRGEVAGARGGERGGDRVELAVNPGRPGERLARAAAARGVAGLDAVAPIAVVAGEGRTRMAGPAGRVSGLLAVADVAVVAAAVVETQVLAVRLEARVERADILGVDVVVVARRIDALAHAGAAGPAVAAAVGRAVGVDGAGAAAPGGGDVLAETVGEANIGAAALRERVPGGTVRVAVAAALDRLGNAAHRLAAGGVDARILARGAHERRSVAGAARAGARLAGRAAGAPSGSGAPGWQTWSVPHVSVPLHGSPSSQSASVWQQPGVASAQACAVQILGHTGSPSSHSASALQQPGSGVCVQPCAGSHASSVQTLPSSQSGGGAWTQTPP